MALGGLDDGEGWDGFWGWVWWIASGGFRASWIFVFGMWLLGGKLEEDGLGWVLCVGDGLSDVGQRSYDLRALVVG